MEVDEELPPRSDDEFAVPSTSTAFQPFVPSMSFNNVLQEMLLASPSHLFSAGLVPPDRLAATWEQWLCVLASSLTSEQWQTYWIAHNSVFGPSSVPIHLLSFFAPLNMDPDCRHTPYGGLGKYYILIEWDIMHNQR